MTNEKLERYNRSTDNNIHDFLKLFHRLLHVIYMHSRKNNIAKICYNVLH